MSIDKTVKKKLVDIIYSEESNIIPVDEENILTYGEYGEVTNEIIRKEKLISTFLARLLYSNFNVQLPYDFMCLFYVKYKTRIFRKTTPGNLLLTLPLSPKDVRVYPVYYIKDIWNWLEEKYNLKRSIEEPTRNNSYGENICRITITNINKNLKVGYPIAKEAPEWVSDLGILRDLLIGISGLDTRQKSVVNMLGIT